MEDREIDWIVDKASGLLMDKVEEAPLDEGDIELAFEVFAEPRLRRISDSFSSEDEYTEAANRVKSKLREVGMELNEEIWSE